MGRQESISFQHNTAILLIVLELSLKNARNTYVAGFRLKRFYYDCA
jgi:hypothetical protein